MGIIDVPRGPLYLEENGTPDFTKDYMRGVLDWSEAATEEAEATAALNAEINQIGKYIQVLQGNFWPKDRPRYKSRFVVNKTGKARYDWLAQLTDTRPTVDITCTSGDTYKNTAEIIHKVLRYEWQRGDMDLSVITLADITAAWGTGFWKLGAAAPGMMKVTPCGPDQVMPIQPGFHIQDSTAVMYRTWKALSWVRAKYPMLSAGLEKYCTSSMERYQERYQRPTHIPEYTWNGMNEGMKRLLGAQNAPPTSGRDFFKTIEWREFYVDDLSRNESNKPVVVRDAHVNPKAHNWWYVVQPGERLYPNKRLLAFAGKRLVYDGPNPFWHGMYPFAMLRFNPVFYSIWGLSKYRDLIPLNQSINEIVAGTLDLIKHVLNPTIVGKDQSLSQDTWKKLFTDLPGKRLRLLGPSAQPTDLKYLELPQVPSYIFQMLSQFLDPQFDKMAGFIDIAGMGKKKQLPAGETIEQMRDSQQTGMRLEGRMIEKVLDDAGLQQASNVIQFYTASQRMHILGVEEGTADEDFDFKPGELVPDSLPPDERRAFHKLFNLKTVPGSLHSGAKDREKQMAISLALKKIISLRECLRKLDYSDAAIDRILNELKEEGQAGVQFGGGRQPRGQAEKKGMAA